MAKKAISISIIIIGIILVCAFGYAYSKYKVIEQSVEDMQITFDDSNIKKTSEISDSILFLLLGIGDRPGDPGRADSIMLVSINPIEESVLMFNIPRDTRTEIIGKGFEDKINHSYAFGRTEMVKDTVENFIDHPIDYIIQINMNGMRQLVDAVGGIEVKNKFAFDQGDELGEKTYHFAEGFIDLDGERALHYSRMRQRDPRGDLGRNERQRQVLESLANKAISFSSITKINEIMDTLGENMKTNITFDEVKYFSKQINSWKDYDIETLEIKGENKMINGVYYYQVSENERQYIGNKLGNHLSLSKK